MAKLDLGMQERLAGFVSLEGLPDMPVDVAREVNDREARVMFGPVESVFAIEEREVEGPGGDIRVRIYRPDAEPDLPMLVYFHGGGWVVGSLDSHDGVARFLCRFGRCIVISVDYRLAPEHSFPAAVEDAWAITTWVSAQAERIGGDAQRMAVGGDSAGGNLATVVALRARDTALPVALQLLVYPALDCGEEPEIGWWVHHYLPDAADRIRPEASPLRAPDIHGVAPVVLLSCDLDPLKVQADAYARRLREAGIPTTTHTYPGLIHGAYRMPGVLPGATKMLEDSAAALGAAFPRE